MILLLIIADDFTGALDTGVQFAANGIRTRVVAGPQADFSMQDAAVLVVDSETRHLPPGQAFQIVSDLTRKAIAAGVPRIYKKIDSALRGNIGAELAALLTASKARQLPFLPAFPQTGRITRGGIHYVDGVPVSESAFGADPFEPVRCSSVTSLIEEQCQVPAVSLPALAPGAPVPRQEGILVFDAETSHDLVSTGRGLLKQTGLPISAGCAGFGAVLPQLLELAGDGPTPIPQLDPRLLVICGSVNPITLAQLDAAEQAGFSRIRLTPRQKLEPGYWDTDQGQRDLSQIQRQLSQNPHCIIESNDQEGNQPTADLAASLGLNLETTRLRVAGSLGHLVGALFSSPAVGTLLLTGGDTLLQSMNCLGVHELEPICEMEKGVVLAGFSCGGHTRRVITKSGGFGQEDLLIQLAKRTAATQQHLEEII